MLTVSLFGTCAGSLWREDLIPMLSDKVEYFNPVVDDWNDEAYQNELNHRANDDYMLYVLTPLMEGAYAVAEVVDDSHKRKGTVIFSLIENDNGATWSPKMLKSMRAVEKLLCANGVKVCANLVEVAEYLNSLAQ